MTATLSAGRFVASMRSKAALFLTETQKALDEVAAEGLRSLKATTQFNNQTHQLRASFAAFGTGTYRRRLSADMPYAHFVEYGTSRMRARPYMGDARAIVAAQLPRAMRDAVDRIARV